MAGITHELSGQRHAWERKLYTGLSRQRDHRGITGAHQNFHEPKKNRQNPLPGKGQILGACVLLYLQQPRGQEGFPKRLVSLPKSARFAAQDEVVAVAVFDAGAKCELKVVSQQESTTLLH